jgi:hypothetical protein
MTWILNNAGKFLADFPKDTMLLKAIGILDDELANNSNLYPNTVSTAFKMLDVVGGKQDVSTPIEQQIEMVLKAKGISNIADLSNLWLTFRETIAQRIDKDYRALLFTLDEIAAMDPATLRTKIDWPIVDRSGSVDGGSEVLKFKLTGHASTHIEMEALPKSDNRQSTQTRIGFHGNLIADGNLPFSKGLFEASASSELKLDYYFYARGSRVLASSLASGLAGIESPFNLEKLQDQLAERDADGLLTPAGLHSVRMEVNRNITLGGQIAMSTPYSLASGITGSITGNIAFSVRRSGDVAYKVQSAPNSRDLEIEIRRGVLSSDTYDAGMDIGIDLSGALAGIHAGLIENLGKASDLLKQLDDILLSGEDLRKKLDANVDAAIKNHSQADMIRVLIGFDAENTASQLLAGKLLEATELHVDKWKGEAEETTCNIVSGTLGRMHLQPTSAADLETALLEPVKKLLGDIDAKLVKRVKELIKGDGYLQLAGLLDKPGAIINRTLTTTTAKYNAVIKPLRETLGLFQAQLAQMADIVEKAAKAKVALNLYYEQTEQVSRKLALKLLMRPQLDPEKAQRHLYEILLGHMTTVFEELCNEPKGGVVEALDGTFLRTANLDRTSGIDVMVLDFQLYNRSILDVDVSYQVDLLGNIRVTSRAEMIQRVRTLRKERTSTFVNVFELAGAGRTGKLLINSTISHQDEHLKIEVIPGFLNSFKSAGNIGEGVPDRVVAALEAAIAQRTGSDVSGEISISMSLEKSEIDRLLQLDRADSFDESEVWNVALPLVVEAVEREGFFEYRLDEGLKQWLTKNHNHANFRISGDIAGAIRDMDDKTAKRIAMSYRDGYYGVIAETHQQYVTTLNLRNQRIKQLAQAFVLMREVYLSGQYADTWSEQIYKEKQEQLDDMLSAWIRPGKKNIPFFALITDEVRPMLVAFYTIVRMLSGAGEMKVSLRLADGTSVPL